MKKVSRLIGVLIIICSLILSITACSSSSTNTSDSQTVAKGERKKVVRFTIGTAGTAGALYPMGVAMAECITNHVDGFSATAEATAASIENLRNLNNGALGWGISQTEIASMAYYGKGDYANNRYDDIRALFSTIYSYLQVFVAADSPINSIDDFKGKTVGVGAAGSGGEMAARALLEAYGLTYNDIKPQFMPETEAVAALKDGKIDGFIATHPLKSAALVDLTTSMKAKLLPIELDSFFEANPAYSRYTVEPGTYNHIDEPVVIPRSRVIMCTSTNFGFSDDDIYEMVKAIWENRDEWANCNASVESEVVLETALEEIDIPLHPGAIRYFEEIGMEVDPSLKP